MNTKHPRFAGNLTGQRFGRLTVLGFSHRDGYQGAMWICKCDCGGSVVRSSGRLRDKAHKNKSCGCAHRDSIRKAAQAAWKRTTKFSHPHKRKLINARHNMLVRCYKTTGPDYKNYGARGIQVCEEWRRNRVAF